jgi:hypothetical protein
MTPDQLKGDLAKIIDPALATVLVDSYREMQQRYYAGDWDPTEFDGGQCCEAVVRALYEVDTGASTTLSVGDICSQLRKASPPPTHRLTQKDREHFCRILQSIYNFRNDRGIAHITLTPDHDANLMDATLIVQTVKWLYCEFFRLARNLDRTKVVQVIEAMIQLEHPLIHELDGRPMVMSTKLSVGEEALLLLNHSPGGQLSKDQLRAGIPAKPTAVNMAVMRLMDSRFTRLADNGDVAITPLGQRRVREEILPKATQPQDTSAPPTTRRRANARRKVSGPNTKKSVRTQAGIN